MAQSQVAETRSRSLLGSGNFVWFVLAAILIALVANPLLQLLAISCDDPKSAGWTLANDADAFSRVRYVRASLNSLMLGLSVAILALALGVPIAWALSRTDMP